jgi:hypothetical protein
MNSSRPLDNFPVIRTRSIEEVRNALAHVYAKPTLNFIQAPQSLNASINECRLRHIRLGYGAFGAAVSLDFPAANCFLHLIPIRGTIEIIKKTTVELTVGTSVTISPDTGFRANHSADYECIVVKIDAQALAKKLMAMTGAVIDEPLRMEPQPDLRRPAAQILRQYLPLLVETLSAASPPFPEWWISQTEQLLMVMFLCAHEHNYSHLLEQHAPDSTPSQVRKAEDYIEANWDRDITLETLAKVTGVSAFSLFRSFKNSRGCSPLEFASQVKSRHKDQHQ